MVCLRGGTQRSREVGCVGAPKQTGSEGTSFQAPRFLVSRARANSKDRTGRKSVLASCRRIAAFTVAPPRLRRRGGGLWMVWSYLSLAVRSRVALVLLFGRPDRPKELEILVLRVGCVNSVTADLQGDPPSRWTGSATGRAREPSVSRQRRFSKRRWRSSRLRACCRNMEPKRHKRPILSPK